MEDYKEKLKLAKEALASGSYDKETIEYIFPELKESEDERIREVIIKVFDISEPDETWGDTDITTKDIIAWLEKQGDDFEKERVFRPLPGCDIYSAAKSAVERQKSGKKIILAFNGAYIPVDRKTVDEIVNEYYSWIKKQGEQKPEIKYIYPKFRVGDVIEPVKPNGYYAPVRVKYIGEGNYSCESDDCKSFLSFPICNENEYVLTEQKSTWSEEDERMLGKVITTIRYALSIPIDSENDSCFAGSSTISWLKSIKERMKGE